MRRRGFTLIELLVVVAIVASSHRHFDSVVGKGAGSGTEDGLRYESKGARKRLCNVRGRERQHVADGQGQRLVAARHARRFVGAVDELGQGDQYGTGVG